MDIQLLKYFIKVAECKNMTLASRELMVAQPAISKMIKKLEADIGYPVFDRKGRNIVLNQNGRILLRYANKIFYDLQSAKDEINDYNASNNRKINVQLLAASCLFPDIVSRFLALHPTCKLHVEQTKTPGNNYDLRIYSSSKIPTCPADHVMLKENIVLVVPRAHRLSGRNEVSLAELCDEDFLALKNGMDLRILTDAFCEQLDFHPQIMFEVDNPSFLREILAMGIGVTFMPELSWGNPDTETTKSIRIADGNLHRFVNISLNSNTYMNSMTKVFHDFITTYYESLSFQR